MFDVVICILSVYCILIGMFIVGVRIDMDKLKDVVLFKIVKEDE